MEANDLYVRLDLEGIDSFAEYCREITGKQPIYVLTKKVDRKYLNNNLEELLRHIVDKCRDEQNNDYKQEERMLADCLEAALDCDSPPYDFILFKVLSQNKVSLTYIYPSTKISDRVDEIIITPERNDSQGNKKSYDLIDLKFSFRLWD